MAYKITARYQDKKAEFDGHASLHSLGICRILLAQLKFSYANFGDVQNSEDVLEWKAVDFLVLNVSRVKYRKIN